MIGLTLILTILVATSFLVADTDSVHATERGQCPTHIAGEWYNPEAELHDLSRMHLKVDCTGSAPEISARVQTSCRPRDCSWGWSDGLLHQSGIMLFQYGGIFKSQHLNVLPGQDRLEVHMKTSVHGDESKNLKRNFILLRD
ncbi:MULTISPECIES: hypothetical protein [Pseudovibrio]|uniref:hypothetical protein n=1 Tax=Stappiaceae TaxID=2821832 RepID=UPI0023660102|nr:MULTISPECIES: hypothetical protein [Pseudovibrio]MDD7909753.1 hypothetical protein [Pseudovibrio exalbescens]MDX5592095.1 hypothetical protein [Pseudovibrio sp. SPO723]